MTRTTILAAAIASALIPFSVQAQDNFFPEGQDWEITLNGSGSNDNSFDNGSFGASGSIGYYLSDNLQLLLRQSANYVDTEEVNGSDTVAATRIALDYHFDLGRVRPFIGANFGGFYGDAIEETFAAGPEAGAKWYVKPGTFLMLMGEYQIFFEDLDDADENFDEGQFIYSVGMGFNW